MCFCALEIRHLILINRFYINLLVDLHGILLKILLYLIPILSFESDISEDYNLIVFDRSGVFFTIVLK